MILPSRKWSLKCFRTCLWYCELLIASHISTRALLMLAPPPAPACVLLQYMKHLESYTDEAMDMQNTLFQKVHAAMSPRSATC